MRKVKLTKQAMTSGRDETSAYSLGKCTPILHYYSSAMYEIFYCSHRLHTFLLSEAQLTLGIITWSSTLSEQDA